MGEHGEIIDAIKLNVVQGRRNREDEGLEDELTGEPGVTELVTKAIEQGMDAREILISGLTAGMEEMGIKYERGEYYIPDMLAAAEAVGQAMDILEPHLKGGEQNPVKGKFVLATVEKDQHDIGKNLVGIMLKGAGFHLLDLGVNVPADRIVNAVEEEGAEFVGLSALLNTTMSYMEDTIKKLEARGLRKKVKVLIGGAPTSPGFAKRIGADAHCKDAFAAIDTANRLAAGDGRGEW